MAFEDAVVLASELRSASTVEDALAAYEHRRRPRTRWALDRARDRDQLGDVPAATRYPLLRERGQQILADHYRGLLEPH
jgi:2-polyprenyl-6-methoxyphenol hydroxylase-like FAD-dependent oxidoreductase